MLWVDLSEPTEVETKAVLEGLFGFHALLIEDCVASSPLPKLEHYDDYLYLVMHAAGFDGDLVFAPRELDLILGKNFLVTYHREALRPVQSAMERSLRNPAVPVRGPDRFAHTILDLLVEDYKPVLDSLRHDLEHLESGVLEQIDAEELFPRVVEQRKRLLRLRQLLRPQTEVATELARGDNKLLRSSMLPYYRDLAEAFAQSSRQVDSWSEQLLITFRVYLNKSGHEANSGIRAITALTALTIPPIVIGGWYGMNYEHMPELPSLHGYPVTGAITVITSVAIWFIMKRKRWI